jgi:hypothetical protein
MLTLSVPLTFNQLADLALQLPKKDRQRLVALLQKEEGQSAKMQLKTDIKEAIDEVNLYKQGKKELRSVWEVLDEL